eukprot:3284465-Pleurochrysis_carterae.AAC.1
MTCLPTLRACTSNWTGVFRGSKRLETTQTPSRKIRRRGVGIGCRSRSFWVWPGGEKNPTAPDAVLREAHLLCK